MNNQPTTNNSKTRTVEVVGLAVATLFLTYCLGVGTTIQRQAAVQAAPTQPAVQKQVPSTSLTPSQQADAVYTVCNNSRMVTDGAAEELCGVLQDEYEMEFLCEAANQLPTTECWVESLQSEAQPSQVI